MLITTFVAFLALVPPSAAKVGAPGNGPAPATPSRMPLSAIPGEREFNGELIVRPRQDLAAADRARAVALVSKTTRKHYAETDEFIVTVARGPQMAGAPEQQMASELLATGLFQYAHPNWTVYPVATPNDPRFGEQWHHTMMECPAAWNTTTGSLAVIVAVTDTGIVTHEDLTHRVPGFNAVSGVPEASGGDMTDIHGHGTHVAGCAAASGNNGLGVSGMGWTLSVMPIRVSEAASGGASYDSLLAGARWAAENGAKSVSASYSGIGYDAIETTGAYISGLDATFMWAAGNSADDHAGWDFEHVMVIGASDASDQRASFSSYGRGVDLFAPGVNILSTINNGGYGFASGTSMATPVANGALGMVRSANPSLSAAHAEYILQHTCDAWGGVAETEQFGFGRINLRKAVQAAVTAGVPQPPVANNDLAAGVTTGALLIDVLSNDYDPNMDALVINSCPPATSAGDALVVLPGAGMGGRDVVQLTPAPGATAGSRTFTYQLREPISGATAQAIATVTLQRPRTPVVPTGDSAGLDCAYYALSGPNLLPNWSALTPYLTEVVASVSYGSTDGVFANSGRADEVGAVYTGWLTVPESGLWTLAITSDDGSRLRIAGASVVENDGLHGMVSRSATVALAAGKHPIQLEFFENGGGAGFIFKWSGPNRSTEVVPPEALSHGGTVNVADLNGDGVVDGGDLGILLGAWGSAGSGANGPSADLNGDGIVNGADLGVLLGGWGS